MKIHMELEEKIALQERRGFVLFRSGFDECGRVSGILENKVTDQSTS